MLSSGLLPDAALFFVCPPAVFAGYLFFGLPRATKVTHRHISWAATTTLQDCLEQDFRVMQVSRGAGSPWLVTCWKAILPRKLRARVLCPGHGRTDAELYIS